MSWIRRRSHTCYLPKRQPLFRPVRSGDEWRCRCGAIWRLHIRPLGRHYHFQWTPWQRGVGR